MVDTAADPHGTVWWSELMTRDAEAAKAYYHDVLGWEFDTMSMTNGEYSVAMQGGKPVAGIMDISGIEAFGQQPVRWFTYLAVKDLDTALEKTRAQGGTVQREPFEVPKVGRIALVTDPAGASVGLMTPAAPD